jgi:4-methylaminobutanoate oxidase (formaldehyde-forming)
MRELRQLVTTARGFGVESELISPREAQAMFPAMTTEGVHGAAWTPGDGYADPNSVTQAFARAARARGVRFVEGCRVTDVHRSGRRVERVDTDSGSYSCDVFVNAAGMWSRDLGALSGADIPACAVEHQYVVTEVIPDLPREMPTMRDPDRLVYYKPEVGALAIGGYEPDTVGFGEGGMPGGFAHQLLPQNLDRFGQLAEKAAAITPVVNEVGLRSVVNGPIPESADGDFVMGRPAGFDNYYVATGFLYGIAAAGGAGEVIKEWIIDGAPATDLWSLDVRRFHPVHNTERVLFARALEHYASHYRLKYPGTETAVARDLRLSPLHHVLAAQGAVFGTKFGWERPNWFDPTATQTSERLAYDRADCDWFPHVQREAQAVRTGVGLIDQTSFSKLELGGARALETLQDLCAADIDRPVGAVIYTQMCNPNGGVEADLTITRLDEQQFYLVTGAGFGVHDFDWIRSHLPADGAVTTREVTGARAVINLCGPQARTVLQAVTDVDVSNAAFPFATGRHIRIGAADVLALRVGYTGEVGWELHIPAEYAEHVYRLLRAAGAAHGITDVGYRALDSLRLEKGLVYWSADVTPDHSPLEAGLGFRVHLDRKGPFLGREALERERGRGCERRLTMLSVPGHAPLYGGEPVWLGERLVGRTTSANYGYAVERTVAMAYLPVAEAAGQQEAAIEAFMERYPARVHDRAPFDPYNERLKA